MKALRILPLCAVALLLPACGGSSTTGGGPTTDEALWPSDAQQLVATNSGGGFGPPAAAGSECMYSGAATFALTTANKQLSWQTCTGDTSGVNHLSNSMRTLSAVEYQTVVSALSKVALSSSTSCGADKSTETIEITTPRSKQLYLDSFYACNSAGTYVDHMDDVFTALYTLVQGAPD